MTGGRSRFGLAVFLGLALLPSLGWSQEEKNDRYLGEGDKIFLRDFGSDDVGYLAVPDQRPDLAIVLAHGWTGLCEGVRRDCDYLADEGHLVLAVDLFNGAEPSNADEARVAKGKLQHEVMVTAIRTGARFFESSPRFKMDRVVVVACQQSVQAALQAAEEQVNIMAVVLVEPEPELDASLLEATPFPVKIVGGSASGVASYLTSETLDGVPALLGDRFFSVDPVWINSWRNRRVNPLVWQEVERFAAPLQPREEALPTRIWKRVF